MTSRATHTPAIARAASSRRLARFLCLYLALALLGASASEALARAASGASAPPRRTEGKERPAGRGTRKPAPAAGKTAAGKTAAGKTAAGKSATGRATTSKKSPTRTTPKSTRSKVGKTTKPGTAGKPGRRAVETRPSRTRGTRAVRATADNSQRYAPRFFDPSRPQTLRAEAAVVVDTRTMKVVWAKNPHDRRPIASLTKLMTTLVVLDHKVDLGDSMTVIMDDVNGAGHSHVRAGNRVAIGDLLRCSLISSDNAATRTLARSTGLSMPEFVAAMNAKARELNLRETHYADPTGLDANNLSTASDQARLIIIAADNPLISRITSTPSYTFLCGRRIESLTNTNRLIRSRSDIVGSKTGFINEAGYCVAMLIGDRDNPYLTTVVLGARSNSGRFAESSKLIDWALGVLGPAPAMASPNPAGSAPASLNPPNRR